MSKPMRKTTLQGSPPPARPGTISEEADKPREEEQQDDDPQKINRPDGHMDFKDKDNPEYEEQSGTEQQSIHLRLLRKKNSLPMLGRESSIMPVALFSSKAPAPGGQTGS
jgi:hypothetical protein